MVKGAPILSFRCSVTRLHCCLLVGICVAARIYSKLSCELCFLRCVCSGREAYDDIRDKRVSAHFLEAPGCCCVRLSRRCCRGAGGSLLFVSASRQSTTLAFAKPQSRLVLTLPNFRLDCVFADVQRDGGLPRAATPLLARTLNCVAALRLVDAC